MFRSEIESLRSPRVELWFGTTVHFESTVSETEEEEEEEDIFVHKMYVQVSYKLDATATDRKSVV